MKYQVVQESQVGNRRRNEDRVGHWSTGQTLLLGLADGMGGHPHGDRAAEGVLETLSALFLRQATPELPLPGAFLDMAFLEAHRRLLAQTEEWRLPENHCTTLVACVVQKGLLWWAHCGDSRLYLTRGDQLVLRTRDHSLAERREALAGRLKPGKGAAGHVLVSCLGGKRRPAIECGGPWSLAEGDRVLLCSDGLWGPLKEPALLHGMHQGEMPVAIPALVKGALAAAVSGSDNVTALGLLCQAASAASPAAPPAPPPAAPSDTEPATVPDPDLVFD
ncbi:MAG: PP2C family serine/threonine-protein phosphatase [Betaproteobacteria bacterium]